MKNCNTTMIAESAIKLLREGINSHSKAKILSAYEIVDDEDFSWESKDLDVLFMEWDELTDVANDILYEGQ